MNKIFFTTLKGNIMKTIKVIGLFLVLIMLSFSSCKKIDQNDENKDVSKPMSSLKVAAGFNWETTKSIEVKLTGTKSGVVYINPTEGTYCYNKGFLNTGSGYTTKITVPSYVSEVKLSFNGNIVTVPFVGSSLVYSFK